MDWIVVTVFLFTSVLRTFGSDPKAVDDPPTECVGLIFRLGDCQESTLPSLTKSELNSELNSSRTFEHLLNVLKAMRLAINYFEIHFESINLDGVFAARITQDQLQVTQNNLATLAGVKALSPSAIQAINEDFTNFRNSLVELAKVAEKRLAKSSKEYYDQMKPLLSSHWMFDYLTRVTNPSYIYQTDNLTSDFNESFSDSCISELIGTKENAGKTCSPSMKCWEYQTAQNTKDYKLTHGILYLQIADLYSGCTGAINELIKKRNQVSLNHLIDNMCANVLQDMKRASTNGIGSNGRDLFMEQTFICGMMGYRDFHTITWLNDILAWQKPEGCYGPNGLAEVSSFLVYQAKKALKSIGVVVEKRNEHIMENWCLSHHTGVAMCALATYLRFLLEDPSLTFEQ